MGSSCPKQYLELAGKPVLVHAVSAFHSHRDISTIIVAVPQDHISSTCQLLADFSVNDKVEVIAGGVRRQDSVKLGLDALNDRAHFVLVHDGARPLISHALITQCIHAVSEHGGAIAAIPVKDTLKKANETGQIAATVDRNQLWQAQTPQCAEVEKLKNAYEQAGTLDVTDEASLLELAGYPVQLVMGSETNLKITRPEDLDIAEKILTKTTMSTLKIGHGFDAHRFAKNRELVLAGVKIKHHLGLAGHSDADVVTHSLCDAILGALGKGDIGKIFPDSSQEFKDIYSIILLERVSTLMNKDGYVIGNCDITVICQEPKLSPYIDIMKKTLAQACNAGLGQINIKATTTEKMGYTGRKEGISSHAVVLLEKKDIDNAGK